MELVKNPDSILSFFIRSIRIIIIKFNILFSFLGWKNEYKVYTQAGRDERKMKQFPHTIVF